MQNNIADHSQHLKMQFKYGGHKTSPPVIVTGMTLAEYNYKTG